MQHLGYCTSNKLKVAGISTCLFLLLGFNTIVKAQFITEGLDANSSSSSSSANEIPIEHLQNFANVISNIKHYYVEPVDDKELFENAIRGMLAGLDPHSSFLDESDFEDLKTATSGKFGGLGIEVTMEDGFVKVVAPIDETPAAKAGVKAGDLIVKIDTTPVKGLNLKQAVDLMRGKPNTEIKLLIVREGETAPIDMSIMRDIIKIKSVKNKLIDNHYGYIRISQFQSNTAENVLKAIDELKTNAKNKQLNGIVLDLRNNPGGVLTGAIKVSDIFLDHLKIKDNSVIVSTKGRAEDSESSAYSRTEDATGGVPVVVLVNNGSASASEIVAGALQDHKRAIVMGTPTFGKGSVQTVLPLKADQGLKLTTALYYTPSGKSIQATGIVPDVLVENLEVKKLETKYALTTEADLKDHLDNGNKKSADNTIEKTSNPSDANKEEAPLAETDYQLNEAINLLKGLKILARS